jgi:hypothetical protein
MADIPMMPGRLNHCVYIYAGKRTDLGSFLYIGESAPYAPGNEVGIGLIPDVIGVANPEHGSARILATTSFVASHGGEFRQRFDWQVDSRDYA